MFILAFFRAEDASFYGVVLSREKKKTIGQTSINPPAPTVTSIIKVILEAFGSGLLIQHSPAPFCYVPIIKFNLNRTYLPYLCEG